MPLKVPLFIFKSVSWRWGRGLDISLCFLLAWGLEKHLTCFRSIYILITTAAKKQVIEEGAGRFLGR